MIISDKRMEYIEQKVAELHRSLNIQEYPINMLDLLKQHFSDKYLVYYTDFSEQAEVVTNYYPDYGECVILINNKYVQPNLMKRLNFSLAHEFGHIVLKHYICRGIDGFSSYYEKEADEFAGQFLMPKCEIEFLPKRLSLISDYFYVSETAASVRLERVKYHRQHMAQLIYEQRNKYDEDYKILLDLELKYYEP